VIASTWVLIARLPVTSFKSMLRFLDRIIEAWIDERR